MKMKELEARTGVGREAIRFYIREGLLHEPEKPKPNVARYDENHVRRVLLIKKLQKERFLPLGVIKSMIESGSSELLDEPPALFGIEFLLASRLEPNTVREAQPLKDVARETGLPTGEIEDMEKAGLIEIASQGGRRVVGPDDLAILQIWKRFKEAGYTFKPEQITFYGTDIAELSRKQVELFFEEAGDTRDMREAADLAYAGLTLSQELFAVLNVKAIVKAIALRNAQLSEKGRSSDTAESEAAE
jgi:DNA-binding transcriptional MerR regulator